MGFTSFGHKTSKVKIDRLRPLKMGRGAQATAVWEHVYQGSMTNLLVRQRAHTNDVAGWPRWQGRSIALESTDKKAVGRKLPRYGTPDGDYRDTLVKRVGLVARRQPRTCVP